MSDFMGILRGTRKHLMNGVSYMIPLVVGSGILMAISLMIYGEGAAPETGFAADLWGIGVAGMGLMVPLFSAFIASSIADRAGIAPGLVGGMVASNIGAGFLGGIVSGLFAGIVCFYLKKIPLHKTIKSVGPILIIPIIGIFLTGGLMQWVIGTPIAGLMDALTVFLTSMSEGNKIILGLVAGAMIGFDLGGPVNKVAYSFMVATVGMGIYSYAGPVGLAICVPPISAGVASLVLKKKFNQDEKDAGIGAIVMGCCGISEGAISYTANDPVRMIPINMISCAVSGAVAYALDVTSSACWGGLIVLPVVGNRIGYLIALLAGVIVYVGLCAVLKKDIKVDEIQSSEEDDVDMTFEF